MQNAVREGRGVQQNGVPEVPHVDMLLVQEGDSQEHRIQPLLERRGRTVPARQVPAVGAEQHAPRDRGAAGEGIEPGHATTSEMTECLSKLANLYFVVCEKEFDNCLIICIIKCLIFLSGFIM